MKILQISFKNINSLRGRHHIDFTAPPFDTSPLFAITGPTGSGKSTLLDVISLALFNQVPRLGRISKKEILAKGAILTRNQREASASVTYRCKDGTFTSNWQISTNRNNKLRDYEMEIADESGQLLDFKKSQVPEANERLIGLNYDQFIKSVLLAQGEFAQFLKAKKDERGELLEKITGTGIYRELGKKAFERYKTEIRKIDKQQGEIDTHQNELLEDAVLEKSTKAFEEGKKDSAILEPLIKRLEKSIELKISLAKIEKEISNLEKDRFERKKEMAEFEERSGTRLGNHEKIRPIAEELRTWSFLQETLVKLDQRTAVLSQNRQDNQSEIEALIKSIHGFIGKKANPEEIEAIITRFSREVRTLQDKLNEKSAKFKSLKSVINEQARQIEFSYTRNEDNLGKLETLRSESEKKMAAYSIRLDTKELNDITATQQDLKRKMGLSQQLEKIEIAIKQQRDTRATNSAEAEKIEGQQKALPKEIELAEAHAEKFEAKGNDLQKSLEIQRQRASLEEHRAKLRENEPCPLCGSQDHPFAEHLPMDPSTEEELDALRKAHKKWNTACISKKSALAKLNEQKEEIDIKIASILRDIEALIEREGKLSEGISVASGTTWENLTQDCQSKLDALSNLEQEKKVLSTVRKLIPNVEELEHITADGTKIRRQLTEKYGGSDINEDTRKLLKAWTELKVKEDGFGKQIEETNDEIKTKQEEKGAVEKLLDQADSLEGFATIAEARKVLLDERTFGQLQAEKNDINKDLNRSETAINFLKDQFDNAKKADVAETLKTVQHNFQVKQNELKTVREQQKELERKLTNHKEKTEKIAALKKKISTEEKQIKRWKLLDEIIGDAKGKKFNDFAQDLTLRHLIALANNRLQDLSDRYRLDVSTDEKDDGLVALDDHMGGQRRSVKTLSGGETFILSLSMALALSDLASKNVEINSLFIDEGFGTLDPETLDQTLDTLERLQSESSKMIGIISHVDSLKERIATQIQLKRNGQGYSTLSVR